MKISKKENLPVHDFLKYEEFISPKKEDLPHLISSIKKEKSLTIFCDRNFSVTESIEPFIDIKDTELHLIEQSFTQKSEKIVIIGTLFTAQMLSLFNAHKKIIFFQVFEESSLEDLYKCLYFEFEAVKLDKNLSKKLTNTLNQYHG